MYNGVLEVDLPMGVELVGFADDLAIIVRHRDRGHLEVNANIGLNRIDEWMADRGLRLAPHKTEAVLLKGAKPAIVYLGLTIDSAMSFGAHIRTVASKAERVANMIRRLMPNIGGPGERRRRILGSIVYSITLYGAPVWEGAMRAKSYRAVLCRLQRTMALRICRAYHTVSYEATMVVASLPPIYLMAKERRELFETRMELDAGRRKAYRTALIRDWQAEWTSGSKGAWTRRLIPEIAPWIEREHGEVDFHITQALTGHGCVATYTHRIGKSDDDSCWYCQEQDTPRILSSDVRGGRIDGNG